VQIQWVFGLVVLCLLVVPSIEAGQGDEEGFGRVRARGSGFEGKIYFLEKGANRLPDFRRLTPQGTIFTPTLNVPSRNFDQGFPGVTNRFEWFAIKYTGFFEIDEPATFNFRLTSDDGSRLIIDDQVIINNDGLHPPSTREGSVKLDAGVHCIRVDYFQGPRFEVALQLFASRDGRPFTPFNLADMPARLQVVPVWVPGTGAPGLWGFPDPIAPPWRNLFPGARPLPWTGGIPGRTQISPDIARAILRDLMSGETPAARGRGGVAWFTTQGNPYVGTMTGQEVPVEVSINPNKPVRTFEPAELNELWDTWTRRAIPGADDARRMQWLEQRLPHEAGNPPFYSRSHLRWIERVARREMGQQAMWQDIGRLTRESPGGIGRVILQDTALSANANGEFMAVAEGADVRLQMRPGEFAQMLIDRGVVSEATHPELFEEARAFANRMRWAGRVQTGLRVGGRALLVVGVAVDGYRFYKSPNKPRTGTEIAGGWAGALALGGAFATYFAPADVAGPVAWIAHGAGTLIFGAIGYFGGSTIAGGLYDIFAGGDEKSGEDTRCF